MNQSISHVEIHTQAPEGFNPQVHVSACYLEIDQKILLLQTGKQKLEPGKWGVPAGKVEAHEAPLDAAKRELFEETGIELETSTDLKHLTSLYIRKPDVDYVYHLFGVKLEQVPEVFLSDEHQGYHWASFQDLEVMPLMTAAKESLAVYRACLKKKRTGASLNAYLILRRGDEILFHLRQNTGYGDGMWALVAGHVEDGESATAALIREAREEIGIELNESQLKVVHVMHRKTNRFNVDVFFDCPVWEGVIENLEPEKCSSLAFYSLETLPSNRIEYNVAALQAVLKGEFYSEDGWE